MHFAALRPSRFRACVMFSRSRRLRALPDSSVTEETRKLQITTASYTICPGFSRYVRRRSIRGSWPSSRCCSYVQRAKNRMPSNAVPRGYSPLVKHLSAFFSLLRSSFTTSYFSYHRSTLVRYSVRWKIRDQQYIV